MLIIQTLTAPEKSVWEGAGDSQKRVRVSYQSCLVSIPAPAKDALGTPGLPCWGPAATRGPPDI